MQRVDAARTAPRSCGSCSSARRAAARSRARSPGSRRWCRRRRARRTRRRRARARRRCAPAPRWCWRRSAPPGRPRSRRSRRRARRRRARRPARKCSGLIRANGGTPKGPVQSCEERVFAADVGGRKCLVLLSHARHMGCDLVALHLGNRRSPGHDPDTPVPFNFSDVKEPSRIARLIASSSRCRRAFEPSIEPSLTSRPASSQARRSRVKGPPSKREESWSRSPERPAGLGRCRSEDPAAVGDPRPRRIDRHQIRLRRRPVRRLHRACRRQGGALLPDADVGRSPARRSSPSRACRRIPRTRCRRPGSPRKCRSAATASPARS